MSQSQDLFLEATRLHLRFPSSRGELTTEDLWDVPLRAPGRDFSLDFIARELHQQLTQAGQPSFVDDESPATGRVSLQLEVVKAVIAVKKEAQTAKERQAELEARRRLLKQAVKAKEEESLTAMSLAQLREELERLS